jgi:cytochrome c-type biogenesis protein CcmH/NrfG
MSTYSFCAGVLSGAAVIALSLWLWRLAQRLQRGSLRTLSFAAAGTIALFAIAASVIYLTIARPGASGGTQVSAAPPHSGMPSEPGKQAQSMDAATAGLAARLAREGGSAEEWELLAKAYDFLGKSEEARLAREHQAPAPGSTAPVPSMQSAMQEIASATETREGSGPADTAALRKQLEEKLKSSPRDVQALLALADLDQRQRQYGDARANYQKVIALKGMTAQAWADYADVLAGLAGGSLGGEAGQAIERALALDPGNVKGLWLKASRAHQEHRYTDALALWKTLRASVPADSPDARTLDANIAEASQLASNAGAEPGVAGAGAAQISGTVSIDRKLASHVASGATLFIYAKAVGSPGPPLAVMRTTAGSWPVRFHLDDSMAMIPSRRLSQFDQVVIEARVSVSGQATPSAGDLFVTSDVLKVKDAKPVALVIDHQIG